MTKIYESPDQGKTVYVREFHSLNRTLYKYQNLDASYFDFNESVNEFLKQYFDKNNERQT